MSRTPIREALNRLSGEGFLERLPHRGYRVASRSIGELAHVFNAMTESLAASRSELIERAESLAQSERHKSELISMVSHELRTPLASVLGFTRLLLERNLPEADRQRYLEIVDAEATRLATSSTRG